MGIVRDKDWEEIKAANGGVEITWGLNREKTFELIMFDWELLQEIQELTCMQQSHGREGDFSNVLHRLGGWWREIKVMSA